MTRFGLFITLDETGADGLVPISSLGGEYFEHDERRHCLVGRSTGLIFHLGDWCGRIWSRPIRSPAA